MTAEQEKRLRELAENLTDEQLEAMLRMAELLKAEGSALGLLFFILFSRNCSLPVLFLFQSLSKNQYKQQRQ